MTVMVVVKTIITTEGVWIEGGTRVKIEPGVIIRFRIGHPVRGWLNSGILTLETCDQILKRPNGFLPVHRYFARIRSFSNSTLQFSDNVGCQWIISNPSALGGNTERSQPAFGFRLAFNFLYLQYLGQLPCKITLPY